MQVQVLLFASLAEAAAVDRVTVEVDPSVSSREFLSCVADAVPELAGRLDGVRVAVDHQFRGADEAVLPGDEIALIPPVSGG